jgi:polar amino acid transport system substrate-binding protein
MMGPMKRILPTRHQIVIAVLAGLFGALGLATAQNTRDQAIPKAAREQLVPTGLLRIGVYPGSPTSLVEEAKPESMRGVSVDIGRSLASRLGVRPEIVIFPRVAEVVAALQRGDVDFTVTNATEERAQLVDFASPLLDLELGLLVPASSSRVRSVDQLDIQGVTIGVTQGSSSERVLGARMKQAKVRTFPTLEAVRAALQSGEIDVFATNKAILFELADRVPGARVLDGRWGAEHLGPAIPKGRPAGLAFLQAFAKEVRANGELERAITRAGLRGTAAP